MPIPIDAATTAQLIQSGQNFSADLNVLLVRSFHQLIEDAAQVVACTCKLFSMFHKFLEREKRLVSWHPVGAAESMSLKLALLVLQVPRTILLPHPFQTYQVASPDLQESSLESGASPQTGSHFQITKLSRKEDTSIWHIFDIESLLESRLETFHNILTSKDRAVDASQVCQDHIDVSLAIAIPWLAKVHCEDGFCIYVAACIHAKILSLWAS